jgi:hypothetical protein
MCLVKIMLRIILCIYRLEDQLENGILTKCGYRCDLCLAYKPNVEINDKRSVLSDGWFEIFGFRIQPSDIICDGCVSCENPVLIDKACPVRPCVDSKGLKNCAFCEEYICEKLKQRIVVREDLELKLKRELTQMEYDNFVKPYESKDRLDKIRKNN